MFYENRTNSRWWQQLKYVWWIINQLSMSSRRFAKIKEPCSMLNKLLDWTVAVHLGSTKELLILMLQFEYSFFNPQINMSFNTNISFCRRQQAVLQAITINFKPFSNQYFFVRASNDQIMATNDGFFGFFLELCHLVAWAIIVNNPSWNMSL